MGLHLTRKEAAAFGLELPPRENKFHAVKCRLDGHVFDSKAEMARYAALLQSQVAGLIADLKLQPRYDLIVAGVVVAVYIGDFFYREDHQHVVEDVKGVFTPVYKLKRRLFLALYPAVKLREVKLCRGSRSSRAQFSTTDASLAR